MRTEFDVWMTDRMDHYVAVIEDLVRLESTTPDEGACFAWLEDWFRRRGAQVTLEPRHPDLPGHPAANRHRYSDRSAQDRGTLVVDFGGTPGGAHTLFSAHVDVVPATPDFELAFRPAVVGGRLFGRGTADTKGNIVMLAAALDFLSDTSRPHVPVSLDLVIEEEIGGNGALSAVLHGRTASAVVVLEPTGLEVFHGHRGCLEFTVHVQGRASHMGGSGVSAVTGAIEYIGLIGELERRLIAQARADPAFARYERPVQINVGTIQGGEWHGSIPEWCRVGGAFGFHPSLDVAAVQRLLEGLIDRLEDPWLRKHVEITYDGIHNGAYLGDPDSDAASRLREAVRSTGADPDERRAWSVSCDARLYHDVLQVPVVVFGAGRLVQAHSGKEYLDLAEWTQGVRALGAFLGDDRPGAG